MNFIILSSDSSTVLRHKNRSTSPNAEFCKRSNKRNEMGGNCLFSTLRSRPESVRLLRKNGPAKTPQGAFPEEAWRFVRGKRGDAGQRSCKKIRFLQNVLIKKMGEHIILK